MKTEFEKFSFFLKVVTNSLSWKKGEMRHGFLLFMSFYQEPIIYQDFDFAEWY